MSTTTFASVDVGMQHPHYADLINRAARALFAGAPTALLARECNMLVAKATVRSWRQGHRRAPVSLLKKLRLMLQVRAAVCSSLCRDFDLEIARREASRIGSVAVRGLCKCASATGREACRATVAIGVGGPGVPDIQNGDRMPQTCSICRHSERHNIEADLRRGIPYRDIARRHHVSKDALSRHRANHMSRHTETGLAAAKEIEALLYKAETSPTWNATVLTIREARRYVEELKMLNLTVPASRVAAPDANAK